MAPTRMVKGVKLHFIIFGLALAGQSLAQDAVERSLLQAQDEAAVQSGGFNKADHLTGDWCGLRDPLQDSGRGGFRFLQQQPLTGTSAAGFIRTTRPTSMTCGWE